MLKYLILPLCESSVSFCHYDNKKKPNLIKLDLLQKAILFAMKENLLVQFVYPEYVLSQNYMEEIDTIEHSDIVPYNCKDETLLNRADVIVFPDLKSFSRTSFNVNQVLVIRTSFNDFYNNWQVLESSFEKANRINIIFTDIENFSDQHLYKQTLEKISEKISQQHINGHYLQLNILTDLLMLESMNNCNSGYESITLMPDGKFYICPAFFYDDSNNEFCGDIEKLHVKNSHIYKLNYSPICRTCDAWQCKRCVWLNRRMTLNVNIPSHEQCVISHIEKNASAGLSKMLNTNNPIKETMILDPFYKLPRIKLK